MNSNDEGILLPSNNHQPPAIIPSIHHRPTPSARKESPQGSVDSSSHTHMAEVVVCSPEILQKMREDYVLFAESLQTTPTLQDGGKSQKLGNEATSFLTEEHPPQQTNTNMSTSTNRSLFQEELNAASLVSLLSSQMGQFEELLQKNEAAQEKIHQLQQGSDWLKRTCESLQQSEREKMMKINTLKKKIVDLEKLVVDMKLNEAESRGREDHYKLQIANLEHLLNNGTQPKNGTQPRRQRNGAARFTQSFTTSPSNVRSGEHLDRNPLLTRSLSSLFRKSSVSDGSDRSCGETPKIANNDVSRKIISESLRRYNPKGANDGSPLHESFHGHFNHTTNDSSHIRSNSYPIVIPERRSTNLSNITDESWPEARVDKADVDKADRSCTSFPSLGQSEVTPHPVFEPGGPQLQKSLSLRGSGTQQQKKEDSHGDAIPDQIDLSYC